MPIVVEDAADIRDLASKVWMSRYAIEDVGLLVHHHGAPADVDTNAVTVDMIDLSNNQYIFQDRPAEHPEVGFYAITIQSGDTAQPGYYALAWNYSIEAVPQVETTYVEVGPSAPYYDALTGDMRGMVENVWSKFADLFDSPQGGPHLQVYFQTHFGRNRIAQLLGTALGKLNTISQPFLTFTQGPEGLVFPVAQWGPLLELGTYIETLKHLIRSYTEQPMDQGISTARLDRRDYQSRWQAVLDMEMADYKEMLDHFKIANMGLSTSPRVLVSGGVYGNYGPTRLAGSAAARPRYWARFY